MQPQLKADKVLGKTKKAGKNTSSIEQSGAGSSRRFVQKEDSIEYQVFIQKPSATMKQRMCVYMSRKLNSKCDA